MSATDERNPQASPQDDDPDFEAAPEDDDTPPDILEADEANEPPRPRRRPLWVMVLIIGMCVYAMTTLRDDLAYFFADRTPVSLGNAVEFDLGETPDDTYVSIVGIRHPGRGVKLSAVFGDKNVFPFMGTRLVYVETLVEGEKKSENLGEDEFKGRLKHFAKLDYFDTFRDFTVRSFGVDVERDAVLIIAHQKPGENLAIPVIYGLLLVILGINLVLLIRRLARRDAR